MSKFTASTIGVSAFALLGIQEKQVETEITNRAEEIAVAREVDTKLSKLWSEFYKYRVFANDAAKYLKQYEARGQQRWANETRKSLETYNLHLDGLRTQIAEIEENEYKGWARFYLVQHIHSNVHCSSFRPTTVIGWLPEVSGLTEVEAVEIYGKQLCTICFKSAPVEESK